jgi:hypothetical protein
MVLLVQKTIFIFIRLIMLVIIVVSFPMYVKVLMCVLGFVWLAVVLVFGRPVSVA